LILFYIFASTILIFIADVITPLGLTVWILYFIPLILTLFIKWNKAPIIVATIFIILTAITFFLSPHDISLAYAIINRVFFSILLICLAFFIWFYKREMFYLKTSEEEYRYLTEWSPDAVIVYREGRIIYANPASLRIFNVGTMNDLRGKDFLDLIDFEEQTAMKARIIREAPVTPLSAQMRMRRLDGSLLLVDAHAGNTIWDGLPAIQVVIRKISDKSIEEEISK
jgi:PAS domain S-box-containing protein